MLFAALPTTAGEEWIWVLLIINAITCIVSLEMLRDAERDNDKRTPLLARNDSQENLDESWTKTLPNIRYVIPFALAFAWLLISYVILSVGNQWQTS